MKKFIIKTLILFIICVLLIAPINYLFDANQGHYVYHMMNEMYQSHDNIDTVFLGSSHVYYVYDTSIADRLLVCNSFNAGSSGQGMTSSYYLLKEICKYHDVRTVYLDTFFAMANIPENEWNVYKVSDFMRWGENKTKMLYSSGGIETLLNGVISFRYNKCNTHFIDNLKYKKLDIYDYSTVCYDNEEYHGKGFVYSFEIADSNNEYIYYGYRDLDLSGNIPVSQQYHDSLINIIEFCQENNINLVLVNQPMPRKTIKYVKGYDNFVRYMKNIADEYGLYYLNFDLYKYETGLTMEFYKDGEHLNGRGAEIYTELFCNLVNSINNGECNVQDRFYTEM